VCINVFSFGNHSKFPFILLANRDEFLLRPTQPAHFHGKDGFILSGIDIEKGGTWLGISKSGRFAMITNYRDPSQIKDLASSRGELVLRFLSSSLSPLHYCENLKTEWDAYNGYNLIVGEIQNLEFWYASNIKEEIAKIEPGIHGVSNAFLDTPWPKMKSLKSGFEALMKNESLGLDTLQTLILDARKFPLDELPQTGVPTEVEEMLSSVFISSPHYGTVCSTVIIVDEEGKVDFRELVHDHVRSTFVPNDFQFYFS
jgi:uncharacterized protein with NRDE domain